MSNAADVVGLYGLCDSFRRPFDVTHGYSSNRYRISARSVRFRFSVSVVSNKVSAALVLAEDVVIVLDLGRLAVR